jgi:hypothetical protein
LRKYLIAAVAALTALCFTAIAIAQAGITSDVKVAPKDAGTKSSPKASKITLSVKNGDTSQTASQIEVFLGKNIKLSTKGLKTCDLSKLSLQGTKGCSKQSIVGSGTADARAGVSRGGVYFPNPGLLPFKVTPYAANAKNVRSNPELRGAQLAFYLEQRHVDASGKPGAVEPAGIKAIARGVVKKASGKYGSKLVITIPKVPAQQYPAGAYNGLEKLQAVLKKGKMITTVGCSNRKHLFKTTITFVPNPNPPKAKKLTTTDTASCSK